MGKEKAKEKAEGGLERPGEKARTMRGGGGERKEGKEKKKRNLRGWDGGEGRDKDWDRDRDGDRDRNHTLSFFFSHFLIERLHVIFTSFITEASL